MHKPLLLCLLLGCTAEPEPMRLANTLQAIAGGEVDVAHTAVVGIVIQAGQGSGACSGSLIAPNLVLTAQHCVADTPDGFVRCGSTNFGAPRAAEAFFVTSDTSFRQSSDFFRVAEVLVPRVGGDLCGNDLAVLVLTENVPAEVATPLVPRIDRATMAGQRFDAIGYGETGDGSGAGTRRLVTDREVLCNENGCGNFGVVPEVEWVGSDGVCQGDSGGPALDDEGRVMGALSRGGQGCSTPVYSSVFGWARWVREMGQYAAMQGGYPEPNWVDSDELGPPPPDTDGDGARDPYDNCVELANPRQADLDADGVGDLCDDFDDRDRGGNCPICDRCEADADCGERGFCMRSFRGAICSQHCETDLDCPADTECLSMRRGTITGCINPGGNGRNRCPEGFVCGGPREIEAPEDDGLCRACQPCSRPADCGVSGACMEIGGARVCTRACDAAPCRGDSVCSVVDGRNLCVAPGGLFNGYCPADWSCAVPEPEPDAALPEPDAGVEEADAAAPEPDAGVEVDAGEIDVESVKGDSGCSATPGHSPAPLGLMLLLLGWLRRRVFCHGS